MSSLCNVKKSVSVPECFTDPNYKSQKVIVDNIYYEEAWDLRMARLGIDIAKLNNAFNENYLTRENNNVLPTMTKSCIEPGDHHEHQDTTIIKMTSSAIADSVIANNPVYTFKQYGPGSSSASASPAKHRMERFNDNYATCPKTIDCDIQLEKRIGNMATLRPNSHRGLLLNNNCYELSSSELVNAILDRDRESLNGRLLPSNAPSAFKPLAPGMKARMTYQGLICNNQCYNSVPIPQLNSSTISNHGYNRQISAPAESSIDYQMKMLSPDTDLQRKSLHFKASRRSLKKKQCTTNVSQQPSTVWTGKPRSSDQQQPPQHSNDINRIGNKKMSQSMLVDDSKLSDNYIKHLKGQEIAGNFIKQFHRPECHIQRTEDRYHMGFHDSRLDMIADSNRPLEEHLWFHPHLSRAGAEQLLTKYPEGSFLVRRSESSVNEYSLSIRYKQKWLHMKISRDQDGQFVLGQYSQPYPSIPIMIRHYSCSFLPVKGANLISLQQPVFRH